MLVYRLDKKSVSMQKKKKWMKGYLFLRRQAFYSTHSSIPSCKNGGRYTDTVTAYDKLVYEGGS